MKYCGVATPFRVYEIGHGHARIGNGFGRNHVSCPW